MNPFLKSPSDDFAAVRDGRKSMPLWLDVDLSTARSIATGTALTLNIAGNSLYSDLSAVQGVAVVHFQDVSLGNTSAPITINPGFIANVPFTQLLVENAAQPGYRMRIFYGVDVDFQAGSGVSGIVSIVDGGKARTMLNQAFSGGTYQGVSATNYAHVQLWNPAGSGKNVFVESILASSGSAGGVNIFRAVAQLANYVSGAPSKKVGSSGSSAEIRNAPMPSQTGSGLLLSTYVQANVVQVVNFREPICLPPGYGLNLTAGVISTQDLNGFFEFFEESA